MALQTSTTPQLDEAQRIIIAECRYTEEYDAVMPNLVEKFTLGQGEKQITVPKVGQMEAYDLTEGVDIVDSEEIGMTTVDLTSAEVGLKVIITDKLVRMEQPSVMRIIGKQMGDAMARKKDKDLLALLAGFSETFGADGYLMTLGNVASIIAISKNMKFPRPIAIVEHPYAVFELTKAIAITNTASFPIPHGFSEDMLKDFWALTIDGVPILNDGNITVTDDTAAGGCFSKAAMCTVQSMAPKTERERDASLRATELVLVSDYGCFELDDGYGISLTFEAAKPVAVSPT